MQGGGLHHAGTILLAGRSRGDHRQSCRQYYFSCILLTVEVALKKVRFNDFVSECATADIHTPPNLVLGLSQPVWVSSDQ